jgi:low affinity Fe/Cu permease
MSDTNVNGAEKSWAVRVGGLVSAWTSNIFAHPYMQVGIILFCVTWFAVRLPTDLLTAALSILAITLTQMVLNRQNEREADDHRRDVAMHAKLDELLLAMKGARDEMAGIEELEEEDIQRLKKEASEAIEAAGEAAGDDREREVAKKAIAQAVGTVAHRAKPKKQGPQSRKRPRAAE